MALFFHTYRYCSYSDLLGIPVFRLSKNELKHQAKYHEDDLTLSEDDNDDDDDVEGARNFNRIEQNRALRKSVLDRPTDAFLADDLRATMKRSNLKNNNHDAIRKSIKESKKQRINE